MRYVDSDGYVFGEIDSLPGCSAVAISHSVFAARYRPKGSGTRAHAERLTTLRKLGYEYVLCTVNLENSTQLSILSKFNWKRLDSFHNDKTGHDVGLFGKHLTDEDFIATRSSTILKEGTCV